MPGDLVHQVQLFVGDLDRVLDPFSFRHIPQDTVNPQRFAIQVKTEGAFFLEPGDSTPLVQDPEPGDELGTFFQFTGKVAFHLIDIAGMDKGPQGFADNLLHKETIFVDLRRGIGDGPPHIHGEQDIGGIFREGPVIFLALLEGVLNQLLPGDIRDRANPAGETAPLVEDRDGLAEQPVGSPIGVDVPHFSTARPAFPDGFTEVGEHALPFCLREDIRPVYSPDRFSGYTGDRGERLIDKGDMPRSVQLEDADRRCLQDTLQQLCALLELLTQPYPFRDVHHNPAEADGSPVLFDEGRGDDSLHDRPVRPE